MSQPKKNHAKKMKYAIRAGAPHRASGGVDAGSITPTLSVLVSAALLVSSAAGAGGSRKAGNFSKNLTATIAQAVAIIDAMNAGPMIDEGLMDLFTARMATAVTGISWIE